MISTIFGFIAVLATCIVFLMSVYHNTSWTLFKFLKVASEGVYDIKVWWPWSKVEGGSKVKEPTTYEEVTAELDKIMKAYYDHEDFPEWREEGESWNDTWTYRMAAVALYQEEMSDTVKAYTSLPHPSGCPRDMSEHIKLPKTSSIEPTNPLWCTLAAGMVLEIFMLTLSLVGVFSKGLGFSESVGVVGLWVIDTAYFVGSFLAPVLLPALIFGSIFYGVRFCARWHTANGSKVKTGVTVIKNLINEEHDKNTGDAE